MAATEAPPMAIHASLQGASIGKTPVLHRMDLSLPQGRWTAIAGPNGAGKSTLLRVLAGLLPARGEVSLQGRALAAWSMRERARQLGWLGQAESGGDDLRVWDVVMLGRLPHQAWLAAPNAADRAAVSQALHAMQVWPLRERRLGALSGGERQRVLLARLLALKAPVWLMDEPITHLDPPHQADWLGVVRAHVAGGGTVVSVLHELGMALQADDLLIVKSGAIHHHGPCASAATHRALQAAFDDRVGVHQVGSQWVTLPHPAPPSQEEPQESATHGN